MTSEQKRRVLKAGGERGKADGGWGGKGVRTGEGWAGRLEMKPVARGRGFECLDGRRIDAGILLA